jgi:hypothetical protein
MTGSHEVGSTPYLSSISNMRGIREMTEILRFKLSANVLLCESDFLRYGLTELLDLYYHERQRRSFSADFPNVMTWSIQHHLWRSDYVELYVSGDDLSVNPSS